MLTTIIRYFEQRLSMGRLAITDDTLSIFHILLTIEICIAGLYVCLGSSVPAHDVAKKILKLGFMMWIITSYDSILHWVVDGFLDVGAKAGGGAQATMNNILRDPDQIIYTGLNFAKPLFAQFTELSLWDGVGHAALVLVAAFMIAFSYILIALTISITYIEFSVICTAVLILLPFTVLRPTSFIGEKGFSILVSMGIKLMCLAIIASMCMDITATLSMPAEATWTDILTTIPVSLAMACLCMTIPSLAANLAAGTPSSLGGLQFLNAGASGAASVVGGAAAAASGIAAASKIGARTLGGAISGAKDGATAMSGSTAGMKAAGAAMGAMGGAAGQAIGSLGTKAKQGYDSLKNHFDKGSQRADQTRRTGEAIRGKMKTFMGENAA
jgi:type IV secretion system protein TrbL